jgi:hypothetical protein
MGHITADLGTKWRRLVSFTSQPLYPQEKSLMYPLYRRLWRIPEHVWTLWNKKKFLALPSKLDTLTHGAEPFSEAATCSYSITPQHFKEHEGSLPCSQEPSTGPYPEPDQFNPSDPIPLGFILILSTHLRLDTPSGLFHFGYPTNILYAFLVSPIRATCPAHLILLDLI